MWRPDDWVNPFSSTEIEEDKINPNWLNFEAGADAILEALMKNPICFIDKGGFYHDIKPETAGYLVFIPDEDEEN